MPKTIVVGMVIFFLLAGCFSQGNDKVGIQKVLEGYFAALNEHDADKASTYVLPESAAAEWLKMFFAQKVPLAEQQGVRYEYRFTVEEITVDSSRKEARVRLTYTFQLMGSYQGLLAPQFEGVLHLRRGQSGWLLVAVPLAS